MGLAEEIRDIGKQAKQAALQLSGVSGAQRQKALLKMKDKLAEVKDDLMTANASDVAQARDAGLDAPMLKRLTITDKVFNYMLSRLEKVAALDDPVGKILEGHTQPTGLVVQKVSVPIGVVSLIYESRPNVTTDAACVCLKSGNAVILRGGSESLATNMVLAKAMRDALRESGLPIDAVQLIEHKGHESVNELLKLEEYVDVIIPRGGKSLIKRIAQGTNIPVIKHYEGLCHLYLANEAPVDWARDVAINSKCQSIEVCNALETLLVDSSLLESSSGPNSRKRTSNGAPVTSDDQSIVLQVCKAFSEKGVEIRGCPRLQEFIQQHNDNHQESIQIVPATEEDWTTEYLAPILSVKVVDGLEEAVRHINQYGSGHTDGIITQNLDQANRFVNAVDSASVLVNASTRLSGGGDYGMGAVVGISTDKLHARGPVGPAELTTYKWVAYGKGHLRG